jgi:hypothetical protein
MPGSRGAILFAAFVVDADGKVFYAGRDHPTVIAWTRRRSAGDGKRRW